MKTHQRETELDEKVKATTVESVKFRDGMIVTADDLDAAQRYPVSLLRTVLRSYFGCGVVCGLGLRVKETTAKRNWVLCVDRGVAIDCQGYPVELCASVELDLSPEPCCDTPPEKVCIAAKRITSDEASQDACSCDTDGPHFDCRRIRDHVVVKAFSESEFDALPGTVCRRPADEGKNPKDGGTAAGPSWSDAVCDSLTSCSECVCGECWILLGCVNLTKEIGITSKPDTSGRRWVKPIEALCPTLLNHIVDLKRIVANVPTMGDRIKQLEDQVAALSKPPPTQGASTAATPVALSSSPTTTSTPATATSSTAQSPGTP